MFLKRLFEIRNQEWIQDGIKYCPNESKNTCSVIGVTNDIDEVFFPSSIKHGAFFVTVISNAAFYEKIKSIQFAADSKLQTIEESAFTWSPIESITIPREVARIDKCAFAYCIHLKSVEFVDEAKFQMIEDEMFVGSSNESITIPPKIIH